MKGANISMSFLRFDHDQSSFIGAYYFFRGDLDQARSDLEILSGSGVNHLWLFIDDYFRKDHPGPVEDFNRFLKIIADAGLKFLPVIGQFISIEEHPEVKIVVGDGTLSSDPRYWNMGCFRHPVSLEWAVHEVTSFLRSYKNHPALCRIGGRIPMSFVHEAYYRTDTPEMGGEKMRPNCYCEFCRQSFLNYLARKYPDPAEFCRRLKNPVADWAELQMPLGPEPDLELWLDWTDHHFLAIPEFLRRLIAAAKLEAPVLSTHECNDFYPGSWQTVLTGNHVWRMGAEIDFGHEDMYPLEFDQQYQIYVYGFMKDIMRSAMDFSRPYTSNGQAFAPWVIKAKLPDNSMIEQVYTSLIHGVSGMVWWLDSNSQLWRQMKEPNEILKYWLPRLGELSPKQPEVALLYSYHTLALDQTDRHTLNLQLIYMALCQTGLPVDILTEYQLCQGILNRRPYRLLILPGVSAMDPGSRTALLSYLEGGGAILADNPGKSYDGYEPLLACPAVSSNPPRFYRTTGFPGPESLELFIPVEAPEVGIPKFVLGKGPRTLAVFDDGLPALVKWGYGKGAMFGAGSQLGIDFSNYPGHIHLNKMFPFLIRMNRDARTLIKIICREAGIVPAAEAEDPGVELGVFGRRDGDQACLVVNHLPEPVRTRIRVANGARLVEAGGEVAATGSGAELLVEVRLDSLRGTWFVFR
ncbi:MAG: beta-galactosidase [Firmicutes bacterium]|nr:beta-galactosidase [Bacillota bacterium]